MIIVQKIFTAIFGLAAFCALLILAAKLIGYDRVWPAIVGPADMGPVNFQSLKKSSSPNQYLACPSGLCQSGEVDLTAPSYALSTKELRTLLLQAIEQEEHIERVDGDLYPLKLRFIQRSSFFRFPDTARIEFFTNPDATSTLAIFSSSQIGEDDFGVNEARVKRWLDYLQPFEAPTSS